ncbi:MAG: hydrogenase formation protein HypD [Calditrichia bacterium]|nr:hydrogenase formation protein HypD [Calditrichia bacterium]
MKYLEEFRNPQFAKALATKIAENAAGLREIKLMEVCGSHTMAIARYGIRRLLPQNIKLISGPGCPVCVTANGYLDKANAISRLPDVIIATFGDMMRVPGSTSSLEKERSKGSDIRIVYSTMDAITLAVNNPDKQVVFLGVGFETTAPTIAASVLRAKELDLQNYTVYCANKTMPNPMEAIASGDKVDLQGFICPAHVSTIIGARPYEFLAEKYGKSCVIAGFEPLDVLEAVKMLIEQIRIGKPIVQIQYSRVTTVEGNPTALKIMDKTFEVCDTEWRGLGNIPGSGLKLRKEFEEYDADIKFDVIVEPTQEEAGCICGDVMQGISSPTDCPLFGTVCTPEDPVGACMVSSEGSCAASYKYEQF